MPILLLTGSRGMLGQAIAKTFADAGYTVLATDRDSIDITSIDSIRSFVADKQIDLIINTAAYNFVDKVEDPAFYDIAYSINALGPQSLAIVAKELDIPFVHYSTDYVFSGLPSVTLAKDGTKVDGYSESDSRSPISKYGFTKAEGERLVEEVGGKFYLCRVTKLFGEPGIGEGSKMSFVSLMLKLSKEKPMLSIVNEEVGCPTFAPHIADATLGLIQRSEPPGIYHMINEGGGATPYQFAEEFFALMNVTTPRKPVLSSEFPVAAPRPKFSALLNTKLPKLPHRLDALKEFLL